MSECRFKPGDEAWFFSGVLKPEKVTIIGKDDPFSGVYDVEFGSGSYRKGRRSSQIDGYLYADNEIYKAVNQHILMLEDWLEEKEGEE